jgi:GT2 family glycosyltransferase
MSTPDGSPPPVRHVVTAVVVAHNGARWLGELIAGLRQQRRRPDRITIVDTGSTDGSRDLLVDTFGEHAVTTAPRTTGFGDAVARGVARVPLVQDETPHHRGAQRTVEWLWLLHDDCAPTPSALERMLELLDDVPSAAVIGPKIRNWPRGRRLLEMGVAITGAGSRETGLEYGEFDQGQHDAVRDVLAVSTAGMLVRRDVYEQLGGFDPMLHLFRDDVDFGWRANRAGHRVVTCPDAIVFHYEAATHNARPINAGKGRANGRSRRIDRRNAIYTLLVNCAAWAVPLVAIRLIFGSILRTLGLLVVKWPEAAFDEIAALGGALVRFDRIIAGRRRRARVRAVSSRAVRHLLPPPWIGLTHAFETLAGVVSARSGTHAGTAKRAKRAGHETGPVSEEAEELDSDGLGVFGWIATRPAVILVLALVVVALVAARGLLGDGILSGGALLAAPDGYVELWQRYLESWHPVELGSGRAAPPYLAVVGMLSTLLIGKVWLAVDVLIIGAVPLAAITAYVLSRQLVQARAVRVWAAATYATLPAVTGAIAAGRLGTCVAIVVLPLVALAALRMIRTASWSATWTTGLLLAMLTAFVPVAYVVGIVLLIAAAVALRARVSQLVAVFLLPPLLLLPWTLVLVRTPALLFTEAGLTDPALTTVDLPSYVLALGNPGGPGAAPFWLLGVLVLVGLAGLLRRDRAAGVGAAWTIVVLGLVVGLVQTRVRVNVDWLGDVAAWPGFAAVMVAGGLIAASALGADGAGAVFSERSFSWRQPLAGLLAVVAVATPLAGFGWWVIRGAEGPIGRSTPAALPSYIVNEQSDPARVRALVLSPAADGSVGYTVLRGNGARLGDAETGTSRSVLTGLSADVGGLLSDGRRESVATDLARYDIGYIYLPPPANPRVVSLLDTTPGISRSSAPKNAAAWRVDAPTGRLRIVADGDKGVTILDSAAVRASVPITDGSPGRQLVLAEAPDSGWQASVDGVLLEPGARQPWGQSYQLPSTAGTLTLEHKSPLHSILLAIQGALVLFVIVLALPTRAPERNLSEELPAEPGGRHGRVGDEPVRTPERVN